jgi:hypothetical protein
MTTMQQLNTHRMQDPPSLQVQVGELIHLYTQTVRMLLAPYPVLQHELEYHRYLIGNLQEPQLAQQQKRMPSTIGLRGCHPTVSN